MKFIICTILTFFEMAEHVARMRSIELEEETNDVGGPVGRMTSAEEMVADEREAVSEVLIYDSFYVFFMKYCQVDPCYFCIPPCIPRHL